MSDVSDTEDADAARVSDEECEYGEMDDDDVDHAAAIFGTAHTSSATIEEEEPPPEDVMNECLQVFSSTDFVMEPKVVEWLEKYFSVGGTPDHVVELLSQNYVGLAQLINLMAECLISTGVDVESVQTLVEAHLSELVCKHFDPKKADIIFHEEGRIDWLPDLITYPSWRRLVYRLSERHPECLLLNFAIKLISDAGFQQEICSVSTVAQQLDIFAKVLCSAVASVLAQAPETAGFDAALDEFAKCAAQSEHTYVYAQALLYLVAQSGEGATQPGISSLKRLAQELRRYVDEHCADADTASVQIGLYNSGGSARVTSINPALLSALHSMLSKRSLNPADISMLFSYYEQTEPPPVELIRDPQFMNLLIDALFKPDVSARLNPEHKPKYVYLLAFAASVGEVRLTSGQGRRGIKREELAATQQAIEKAHSILNRNESSSTLAGQELLAELGALFQCIRYPVVALGVLHWVRETVCEPSYFQLHKFDSSALPPLPLALVDEIASVHSLLLERIFELLVDMFKSERIGEGMDVLTKLELRKMLIDRFIRRLWDDASTDLSLIRYFVVEALEILAPPYSAEFAEAFLPMLVESGKLVTDDCGLSDEKLAAVKEFVESCSFALRTAA